MNGNQDDSILPESIGQEPKPAAARSVAAAPESGAEAEEELQERGSRSEEREDERHKEEMLSSVQVREFRKPAFWLAVFLSVVPPVVLLVLLVWMMVCMPLFGAHSVPMTAFITGAFVSFVAVFGFLVRSAFGHAREKERREDSVADSDLSRAIARLLEKIAEHFSRKPR